MIIVISSSSLPSLSILTQATWKEYVNRRDMEIADADSGMADDSSAAGSSAAEESSAEATLPFDLCQPDEKRSRNLIQMSLILMKVLGYYRLQSFPSLLRPPKGKEGQDPKDELCKELDREDLANSSEQMDEEARWVIFYRRLYHKHKHIHNHCLCHCQSAPAAV